MIRGNRDSSLRTGRGSWYQLAVAAVALMAACVVPTTGGWDVRAEPDDGTADTESDYEIPESVELPIEAIRLASDRLSLQDPLELSASIILPDSCHSFERLEGALDEDTLTVNVVAVGDRQGDVCSQVIDVEEAALLMYPLPTEGVWTVEAHYFDELVQAEVTVTP